MNPLWINMGEDSVLRIDGDSRGTRISCSGGTVSVSQQNDENDHILRAGEGFVIDRKGLVVAWSLTGAILEISRDFLDRQCVAGRLRRFLSRIG